MAGVVGVMLTSVRSARTAGCAHRFAPQAARTARRFVAGIAIAGLVTTGAAACSGDATLPTGAFQLVAFDSCDNALAELRAATKAAVGPYGLPNTGFALALPTPSAAVPNSPAEAADRSGAGSDGAMADPAAPPAPGPEGGKAADHSGTNVHEAGVDEPDLVKTDGRRILTIANGRLSVVDVATRRLVGIVDLIGWNAGYEADIMLAGDHALVLSNGGGYPQPLIVEDSFAPPPGDSVAAVDVIDPPVAGSTLLLVDLNTTQVLSRAQADGSIVDARQVGSTVRVVLRSMPRLELPAAGATDDERVTANRAAIDASSIEAWTPRLEVTTAGQTVRTQVGCEAISRPAGSRSSQSEPELRYSGANLLTILSFDVNQGSLGDGSPVTIAADGETVYSNGTSLYVASNQAWPLAVPALAQKVPAQPRTEIYRFDTTATPPRFVGGGSVPGRLLNQYSMSEWDGRLRVAATTDTVWDNGGAEVAQSQSGVYVLASQGGALVQVGAVEGLGLGEQIYAVRFVGPVGYVVTFRQTDPLYTVDLGNPTAPVVRGELKIPGYSAYLHPVGDSRLIGVGQDATDTGQIIGTQVSLFDVSDLAAPTRLAKYTLSGTYSEAEVDPHAFLYWPATGLLVVPLQSQYGFGEPRLVDPAAAGRPGSPQHATSGALVLRIDGDNIVEVGFVTHPDYGYYTQIRRSLVTTSGGSDTTLWTVSDGGLLATDATTLASLAWIPL